MSEQKKSEKFYFMKLKSNIAKSGAKYWTGKFSYAIDMIGFEKEDGTMTLWLAPQDMDKMKQQQGHEQKPQAPRPYVPKPQPPAQKQYAPQASAYQDDPGHGEDDIPF